MGMDGVELVMEVEETFAVTISDAEAASARTPAILIELILNRIAEPSKRPCHSLVAFNRLRSVLVHQLGVDRRSVRLDTKILGIAPAKGTAQFWRQLVTIVPIKDLPRLRPKQWYRFHGCWWMKQPDGTGSRSGRE